MNDNLDKATKIASKLPIRGEQHFFDFKLIFLNETIQDLRDLGEEDSQSPPGLDKLNLDINFIDSQ